MKGTSQLSKKGGNSAAASFIALIMLEGDMPSLIRILTANKITEKLRLAGNSEGHFVQPLAQDGP